MGATFVPRLVKLALPLLALSFFAYPVWGLTCTSESSELCECVEKAYPGFHVADVFYNDGIDGLVKEGLLRKGAFNTIKNNPIYKSNEITSDSLLLAANQVVQEGKKGLNAVNVKLARKLHDQVSCPGVMKAISDLNQASSNFQSLLVDATSKMASNPLYSSPGLQGEMPALRFAMELTSVLSTISRDAAHFSTCLAKASPKA